MLKKIWTFFRKRMTLVIYPSSLFGDFELSKSVCDLCKYLRIKMSSIDVFLSSEYSIRIHTTPFMMAILLKMLERDKYTIRASMWMNDEFRVVFNKKKKP